MKKYMSVLVFAAIVALIIVPAQAVTGGTEPAICTLIGKMQGIFKTLRILAFVGAGFYMAGWAWEFISKGEAKMDEMKKKGIGLLVIILSFLLSQGGQTQLGCENLIKTGWNE